ncbi:MAG: RNA polymerase sporulation sigma factor SigK [Clostridiales bacterium]|nr:RNA polymerase sporulation sigma factor SigK [Clostridiales bacterium]
MYTNFLTKLLFVFLRVQSGGGSGGSFPPPLSAERERECFRLMKEEGDMEARNELIEHNLRLVAHIVRKYYSSGKNQDDLISIGTIGLIKAVDSFDPKLGARFATYAGKCLQNEILMYFRSQKRLSAEVSMSETIDIDKDGNPLTWGDIIAVDDTIADDLDLKLRSARAIQVINNELSPRERQIISLRYGLGDRPSITQREVASLMGISRSYVSRLEGSALKKIGESLKRYSM